MKNTVRVMVISFCMMLTAIVPAFAYDGGTAGAVGAVGIATAMGVESAYETSVVARTSGRAGASTVNGAKGISFEIIYCDIKNAFHNIKGGLKTSLSASSIDEVADLVTTNKAGEVVQLTQCKDGTSVTQIDKVIQQAGSGKYSSAELVGTTEFSSLYNEKATAKGVAQVATDSGISTKTTTKVANKALGIAPSGTQVLKSALKNSAISAMIIGCVSLPESIANGNDAYMTAGKLVEDATVSAVSTAMATVISAELPALLATLGASAVAANVATTVATIVVPIVGGYALYILADECQFAEKTADALAAGVGVIADAYHEAETAVESFDISEKASLAWDAVSEMGVSVKGSVCDFTKTACESAIGAARSVCFG